MFSWRRPYCPFLSTSSSNALDSSVLQASCHCANLESGRALGVGPQDPLSLTPPLCKCYAASIAAPPPTPVDDSRHEQHHRLLSTFTPVPLDGVLSLQEVLCVPPCFSISSQLRSLLAHPANPTFSQSLSSPQAGPVGYHLQSNA